MNRSRDKGSRKPRQAKKEGARSSGAKPRNSGGDERKRDKPKPPRPAPKRDGDRPSRYKSPAKPFTRGRGATKTDDGTVRLNRFIANSGICSRREADELISTGLVQVNGKIVTELGTKVKPGDEVRYDGRLLKGERPVYVLLNKPKDFVTTTKDPKERRTVMQLVRNACKERIYPVGRLDRQTTGVLLFTNDGALADRLMHPRYGSRKIYHVFLDKALEKDDLEKIRKGIRLDEGKAVVDEVSLVGDGSDKKQVGLEIHIGWNHVVRRIFESLGYKVVKLDRVLFAGLTKKELSRGQWRYLTAKEVNMLKSHGEC